MRSSRNSRKPIRQWCYNTAYGKDRLVSYNGMVYKCLHVHYSFMRFLDDHLNVYTQYWLPYKPINECKTHFYDYKKVYQIDDQVSADGFEWQCTFKCANEYPNMDSRRWKLLGQNWVPRMKYRRWMLVYHEHQIFVCIYTHTAQRWRAPQTCAPNKWWKPAAPAHLSPLM